MRKLLYGLLICLVIVTGVVAFTSKDNNKNNSNSDYTPRKKESHTCYVCGDEGNLKYGSHYYCTTHWAMVKTVVEAN